MPFLVFHDRIERAGREAFILNDNCFKAAPTVSIAPA